LGFNGFIQVSRLYKLGHGLTGTLSLIESIIFSICAIISAYCYLAVCKVRNELTATLISAAT
jgi:TM2 domain-containing membrane protein YozV